MTMYYMCMCAFAQNQLLYPLQYKDTALHFVAKSGHTACVEHLLSTPGIDVNIKNMVSWSIERCCEFIGNSLNFRSILVYPLFCMGWEIFGQLKL